MTYHGIMFHHFYDETHPKGQGAISAQDLEDMIVYLRKHYRLLPADEWLSKYHTDTLGEKDICLTFDDNLKCQYDVAYPVLKCHGLTAFWFIYTSPMEEKIERIELYRYFRSTQFTTFDHFYEQFVADCLQSPHKSEISQALMHFNPSAYLQQFPMYSDNDKKFRYLRDIILGPIRYQAIMDQMIERSSLSVERIRDQLWIDKSSIQKLYHENHIIGLHSHTHPTRLEDMSCQEQMSEYANNYKWIENMTKSAPTTMSHPNNSYNSETLKVLSKLNIQIGFIAHMRNSIESPFEIPRENHMNILKEMKK